MKLNLTQIYLLYLLFHIILNYEEEIKLFTSNRVLPSGITSYYYKFEKLSLEDNRSAYFFMKFMGDFGTRDIQMIIKDEEQNETKINTNTGKDKTWISYKLNNLKSQKFIIEITSTDWAYIYFIDNTKEIITDLPTFIFLNFTTDELVDTAKPLPLIFNINTVQEDVSYYFIENTKDKTYDGENLLEYCIIEGNECNYKGIKKSFNFEKGKKYKILLNPYKRDDTNLVYFETFSIIKEIEFGFSSHNAASFNPKISYFLINITDIKNFYIYFKGKIKSYSFFSEKEKKLLPDEIDKLTFINNYFSYIEKFDNTNGDDFVLLEIYNTDSRNYLIGILNQFYSINSYTSLEIEKGNIVGVEIEQDPFHSTFKPNKYIVLSTNKNMQFTAYTPGNYSNILYILDDHSSELIFINSTSKKSIIKFSEYKEFIDNYKIKFNFVTNNNLEYYFNNYGPSLFMRTNSISSPYKFNITYFFAIEEKYYLYIKKYNGNMNIYKSKKDLDIYTDLYQFSKIPKLYGDSDEYNIVNNDLLIVDGFQLFTFYMDYNCLFDLYFQKVEDLEYININQNMSQFNNLIKLLNENKKYYLNFTVDHLIKLDNNFLDAKVVFTDNKGKEFTLDKSNKVIKDLKGDKITVISSQKALIYFYKKIENYNKLGLVVFDKSNLRKNMKFNIAISDYNEKHSFYIVKDFGFEGYYPMLSKKSWIYFQPEYYKQDSNSITIYIENIFDQIDYELYENEGERYIIYVFDSFDNKGYPTFNSKIFNINNIDYNDNLKTPKNKFNFEVIPPNSTGSIIIDSISNLEFTYQIYTCKNEEIKFEVDSNNKDYYFLNMNTSYYGNIYSYSLINNAILSYTFNSEKEFLFVYSSYDKSGSYIYNLNYKDFSIKFMNIINDNLQILFDSPFEVSSYSSSYQRDYDKKEKDEDLYYIIIGIKNKDNNIESFSDKCYLTKLMINNPSSLVIKTFLSSEQFIFSETDISKLNIKKNKEIIVTIACFSQFNYKIMAFSKPKEYILGNEEEPIEINFFEEIIFSSEYRNYFKFNYKHENNNPTKIYFNFQLYFENEYQFLIMGPKKKENFNIKDGSNIIIDLEQSGTYYIKIIEVKAPDKEFVELFTAYIFGRVIDSTDFTKKTKYYNNIQYCLQQKDNPNIIKVNNLKEDTDVFFDYSIIDEFSTHYEDLYPNPFEICDENDNCEKNITIYKFISGKDYTIYINFISDNDYGFCYPSYFIFPISKETINKNELGDYSLLEPKIFFLNLKNSGDINILTLNCLKIYISFSKNDYTLETLDKINCEKYDEIEDYIKLDASSDNNYTVVIPIPSISKKYPPHILMASKIIEKDDLTSHILLAGKTEIIDIFQIKYNPYHNLNRLNQINNKLVRRLNQNNNKFEGKSNNEEMEKENEKEEEQYYSDEDDYNKNYEEDERDEYSDYNDKDYEEEDNIDIRSDDSDYGDDDIDIKSDYSDYGDDDIDIKSDYSDYGDDDTDIKSDYSDYGDDDIDITSDKSDKDYGDDDIDIKSDYSDYGDDDTDITSDYSDKDYGEDDTDITSDYSDYGDDDTDITSDYSDYYEDDDDYDDEEDYLYNYNLLIIYSSPVKNLKYINPIEINNNKIDLIAQNDYFSFPVFIDKYEKDINISINKYFPRYAYFGAASNALLNICISGEIVKNLGGSLNYYAHFNYFFPTFLRVITDINSFYDYMNYYFYNVEIKTIIYVKELYGNNDIYECDASSIDKSDLSILTKPISTCKNKKSILNRIYKLEGTKIISGYYGPNSFYDAYFDFDDDNRDIKIFPIFENALNNTAKYLKKDIEYKISFTADHLVKLDPNFDAEISIYNDNGIYFVLNSNNHTAKIKGNDFKIKASNNAMVYFYGKLKYYKQIKIDPDQKGKNYEINTNYRRIIIVDFGFEGYNPMITLGEYDFYHDPGTVYFENIYDKLKTKLVEGEYLYLYYNGYDIEVNYTSKNLNHPKNGYTFLVIPNNTLNDNEEKALIINNYHMSNINYQIKYCKSPHYVKMLYKSSNSDEEKIIEFYNETMKNMYLLNKNSFKLRFESEKEFVFSYSFSDSTDDEYFFNWKWFKERQELTNLTINDIKKKKNKSILSIEFNPNYKNSSTRYIIVIASKDINNNNETFSNPCYITKLVTNRIEGVKIIDFADIGEKDYISLDIDFSDMMNNENDSYIMNIISQELRFGKMINYYIPYEFSYKLLPIDVSAEDDDDDDDDFPLLYTILISVGGVIFLIILVFFIIRCIRIKNQIDFNKETKALNNEKLLEDI